MGQSSNAVNRVTAAAKGLGLDVTPRLMPESTRTAEEAAVACRCTVGQIVKSLIFKEKDSDKPLLFLVSGANRVHEKRTARTIGMALVRPDAAFVRSATGFAIGGIPPFGHAQAIVTYVDRDLLQYQTVWAAAGTPYAVFSVSPERLVAVLNAPTIPVT
ncbi:YbaK/EbsC family protein [Bauldia sp.]|uniref:YbaK/EbsC family protein n=1 Tax=Bauldia sp. TaxID=2575872 RepID=UPI003BACFB8F